MDYISLVAQTHTHRWRVELELECELLSCYNTSKSPRYETLSEINVYAPF